MKEHFAVRLASSCNPKNLLERFELAGISFVGNSKHGYIFEYDTDVIPRRHNRPGQGRPKKPLLKSDGTPYTCGDVYHLCSVTSNACVAVNVLNISGTTFYTRRKAHIAAGDFTPNSTVPF